MMTPCAETSAVKTRTPFFWLTSVFFVFAFAVVITGVVLPFVAPQWGARKIEQMVMEDCHRSCSLVIGHASYSIFSPAQIIFNAISYKGGHPGASTYDAHIEKLLVTISFYGAIHRQLIVHSFEVVHPEVTLVDGDKHSPMSPEPADASPIRYTFNSVHITRGIFTYIREHQNTHAELHMAEIEGEVEPFGNTDDVKDKPLRFHANTQIEKSGNVTLDVVAYLDKQPQNIDVDLGMTNQNLAGLSKFFEPNAGVKLEGVMQSCHGTTKLRGQSLDATLTATFKDLDITLQRRQDRSWISAFLQNIGAAIDVNKNNGSKPVADRTRRVLLHREKNEKPIPFILRGLKEAALKVARAD